ncbi:MAG: OmcA/MtrC family decaheme c-type cytochrome [Burkholderiales bacterium]
MNLQKLTTEQFAATAFKAEVTSVSIAGGPPVVNFKVTDGFGTPIVGLGSTSKASTATVASYPNLAFAMAKLVPGVDTTVTTAGVSTTTSTPKKWVSYIVTTVPTTTAAATARAPSTDANGTLVDNGDGSYKYTFFTDVTKVKDQVAGFTLAAPKVAADLGDLTYDAAKIHRLTLVISGNVPGTGTNTATAVQAVAGVPIAKPVNVIYDFLPSTGKAVALADAGQRLVVDVASCNECHTKLGGIPGTESAAFHGGSRQDPKYCVVCHTDQRKFGAATVTSTNYAFPGTQATIFDGVNVADFPVLIHRVHKGEMLIKSGYNFGGVLLNETRFPQDIRNCTKCHDNTAPKAAPQADNYKNVPSRLACGACHDGIDFATGTGKTNAGALDGHLAKRPLTDDTECATCHKAATIVAAHVPVSPPNSANALLVAGGNNNTNAAWIANNSKNLPEGAIQIGYDIKSASRNASKQPVIVFKMLQNGVAVPLNDKTTKTEIWDNFMGSPSVYFVFSVPQDGIAAPQDFNASASGYIKTIWNGTATGTGAGTIAGPDTSGYYTITLTGVAIPDSAKMLTAGVGYTYGLATTMPLTQTNLTKYPTAASTIIPALKTGGLIVIAEDKTLVATGYTGRHAIVVDTKCNACHEQLGVFTEESFHAGQRNDGNSCSWCHTPNRTSSGWSADSASFVHAIHAASKRVKPFTWHAATVTSSFDNIAYPAVLANCETCHITGTYDFSATASASAVSNRLYRTVGTGKYNAAANALTAFSLSPYVTADNVKDYGAGFSFNAATGVTVEAAGTTLVNSPVTTSCFSCHDSDLAVSHMRVNGGSIYAPRATALATTEQCLVCHGTGRLADIKVMHAK